LGELTPSESINSKEHLQTDTEGLPAATLPKAKYFEAEEYPSPATENTYLSEAF